jgi:hypothetical protein
LASSYWYPGGASYTSDHLQPLLADNQGAMEVDMDIKVWAALQPAHHDRDIETVINLSITAASSAAEACGGDGAGFASNRKAKLSPVKQESNGK